MECLVTQGEDHAEIVLQGSLTNDSLLDVKRVLLNTLIGARNGLVLDFERVDFICSAGLGMLYSIHTEAMKNKKKVIISNVSNDMKKLLSITGVSKHIIVAASNDEALQSILS